MIIKKIQPPYLSLFRLSLINPNKSNRKPRGGIKKEKMIAKKVSGFLNASLAA